MAKDVAIHVLEGVTREEAEDFMGHFMGSKYFSWDKIWTGKTLDSEAGCISYSHMARTPHVRVGQVSWLKAGLFKEDESLYVPATIGAICNLIGEDFPVIGDAMIEAVKTAFELENTTQYTLEDVNKVVEFLKAHVGKKAFVVSW